LIKLSNPPEKEQDFMEEKEFDDFVNQLDVSKFYEIRDRALYETLWSTGLRIGEALALNRSDFAKGEKVIKNEKGGSEAKVFFSDRCIYWLNEYMKRRADNCEALFVTFTNEGVKRVLRCRARQRLADYRKKFGGELKITHMAFRRSFGSEIINKGADIKQAQYLMRHRSERTILKFYAKVKQQKLRGIHNAIFNKAIPVPVVTEPQKVPCG
jgi:site-specific recombinase XerD